jgi:phosphoglycolate phosphatase
MSQDTFGLADGLDLAIGAYGSDDPNRAILVRIAQDRAGDKYRTRFEADSTVLIGDTPSDLAAARDGGTRIVAVATGRSTAGDLHHAGHRPARSGERLRLGRGCTASGELGIT